jgi:putative flippase GtrA
MNFRNIPSFMRFVAAGGANTLVTYIVYLILVRFVNYNVAYILCYATGIAFSYWVNTAIVFKATPSVGKFIIYPVVYVVQFLLAAGVLNIFVGLLQFPKELGPIVVAVITLPVTYVLSRTVLVGRGR